MTLIMTSKTTITTIMTLTTMTMMMTLTEATVHSQCFPGGYCFYTTGEMVAPKTREDLEAGCMALNSQSRPLELHDRAMQADFEAFVGGKGLKLPNVFINLIRIDQPWTWLDASEYIAEDGNVNVKEYHIDTNSEPFAFVNRLSMKILLNPNTVEKSLLSELDRFLCSFKGSCADTNFPAKFQVGEMCYIFQEQSQVNWMNAYNGCSNKNSTLAIIPPELLADFKIEAKKVLEVDHPYWIGLSKMQWQWLSKLGEPIDFYNWYHGYPFPNTISVDPSKVFAYVQPVNGYIWVDGGLMNATLVCLTKSDDTDWAKYVSNGAPEIPNAVTSVAPPDVLQPICDSPFSWKTAREAIIAIPVVLGICLIASVVANIVLAVMLVKKAKVPKPEEKKEVVDEFFHYG